MHSKFKISLIIIITALISGSVIFWYQQGTFTQEKESISNEKSTKVNEITLSSILIDTKLTLQESPSKYALPIQDQQDLLVVIQNPQIVKKSYIGGDFYLITKNVKQEEIDRLLIGDQFVWGIASGMRNFELIHYKNPTATEEHVPTYKITLDTLDEKGTWESYFRVDDGKIFLDENLSNNS